jgi:uncharacterized membrane protein
VTTEEIYSAAPSRDDPLISLGSEAIGGPLGRHAIIGRSWWTPIRVLVAMVFFTCAVGLIAKVPCRSAGWASPGVYSHACYSDLPALYNGRGLADGLRPYFDELPGTPAVEYPVLTGAVMWVTAVPLAGLDDSTAKTRAFFDLNVFLLALCAAVTVVVTAATATRRPWDAALVALAPGLALAGTINWDLWAVMLTALTMLAWSRRRPGWAGLALGLATATKFYPLLLLGPLLVLAIRTGRWRELGWASGMAALSWLVVNVPVALTHPHAWGEFYQLSRTRPAGFGSLWFSLEQLDSGVPANLLNLMAGGLFGVLCLAIAIAGLSAPRRPRFAQLAFLTVAAFLLTNKVYSPQYVLWLIPLAAVARPRWRDFGIWQAGEVVHYVAVWSYLASYSDPNRALSGTGYALASLLRIATTSYFVALVLRDIYQPGRDPVRADGTDDPTGGPFDRAPDVLAVM